MSETFEKKALIVGGGVAGIQAALDIADGGYQVILVNGPRPSAATWFNSPRSFPPWTVPNVS